jgi:signal transduction histidine kinase
MSQIPGSQSKKASSRAKIDGAEIRPRLEHFAESIVQSLPIGIIAFDQDLKIIGANRRAAELIELHEYMDESLAKCTACSGTAAPNWAQQLKSTLSTGSPRTFDAVAHESDSKKKLLRLACIPLRAGNTDTILGGSIVIEDMTEKTDLQKERADAERLATIGELVCKVAHELNGPLDGILRYINLAARMIEQEELEKPKEYLARCRQALMKMVQIVNDLLQFSRSSHVPLECAKIEETIEDALKAMGPRTETSNIRVLRDYASGPLMVRSANLLQVFCNIIKNAYDAMPNGGELRISTRLANDNTVAVEFRDTGTGFPPENRQAIFEPFFTTKDKGSGLGLAICRDIVERHRGRISAENAPEGGSIFTISLPSAANP